MIKYSRENKGHKYFLSVIDCFSRYAWTIPLKNKKLEGIAESFKQIFKESGRKPERLQVDEGKEFMGKFSKFCVENKINKFSTQNRDIKACITERFNRTIEEKIEKVLTENDNNNWISILPDLMINYNNSYHSSIKMTSIEASKKENTELVYANLFPEDTKTKIKKPRY
jgi:transposase InsO family protein